MYDLVIVGAGPAGAAAAVYAARKRVKTLLITEEIGGQSTVSDSIENWIGTTAISGADLAKSFRAHIDAYKGDMVSVIEGVRAISVERGDGFFSVTDSNKKTHTARAVLITTGAGRKKLTIPGAEQYENKGVVYCASCDGPLFAGKNVAVIGGGNAGFETAHQLLSYCPSVSIINRSAEFKADPVTVEKARTYKELTLFTETIPLEVVGDAFVTGLKIENAQTKEVSTLPVAGVFVEIGVLPNTDLVKDIVPLDAYGRVIVDPKTQRTSVAGIWAAGDCTDELFHQNNIAVGDGVKALEDIYLYLKTL